MLPSFFSLLQDQKLTSWHVEVCMGTRVRRGQPALITLLLFPPLTDVPSQRLTFYPEQQKMNKSQVSCFFSLFPISFSSRFCGFYKRVHILK